MFNLTCLKFEQVEWNRILLEDLKSTCSDEIINLETEMINCRVGMFWNVVTWYTCNWLFYNSARQKIEEDLSVLDRQIRLQMGEDIKDEVESLAEAYLATPMVSLGDTLSLIYFSLNLFILALKSLEQKWLNYLIVWKCLIHNNRVTCIWCSIHIPIILLMCFVRWGTQTCALCWGQLLILSGCVGVCGLWL